MTAVKLERAVWHFSENERLGPPGGFGEVFKGAGSSGQVAIKRLHISAATAAHREMEIGSVIADGKFDHIVPVLDFGKDADSDRYYLVMPICELSLHDKLQQEGSLSFEAARLAAIDILSGLREVGNLVHRDLKPGNVLWYGGKWNIADFGIAKFVEDSTSLQTLRDSLTPLYGAPEQWRSERPTSATDVYAVGCIVHAMLNGHPPFTGSIDDVRDDHLHKAPPPLLNVEPRLNALVNTMLRKAPESRPTVQRCIDVLTTMNTSNSSGGRAAMAAAGSSIAIREAEAEARRHREETIKRDRINLGAEGISELHGMIGRLFDEIVSSTDCAKREKRAIVLGAAHLSYTDPNTIMNTPPNTGIGQAWDVVTGTVLKLRCNLAAQQIGRSSTYTYSANLVFAKTPDDGSFRWREVCFYRPFQHQRADEPNALNPNEGEFYTAVSRTVLGGNAIAFGPLAIDAEDEDAFLNRWLLLFAKAAEGRLFPPDHFPLQPRYFE